ncbi:MAG: protein-glutamate O-methyltransferase CheR [Pseudomonadota bacterium]
MSGVIPAQTASFAAKDVTMSDDEFARLVALIHNITGINIVASKRPMLTRRIKNRLAIKNVVSYSQYMDLLERGDKAEIEVFTNSITTNLTAFMRESHHFDYLGGTILPALLASKANGERRLRLWSAGCSTGEEPYSIAMTLQDAIKDLSRWDAKVLCTDLDTEVLKTARKGHYALERFKKLSTTLTQRWFEPLPDGKTLQASAKLKSLLTFNTLNLMHDWPMTRKFDVIFCRNVIIYFDQPTQKRLIDRFADILEPEGFLIVGHSESLTKLSSRFRLIGNTIYQRLN